MSYMKEYKQELAEKIRYLSQNEGLRDGEIAKAIHCSRATVNRIRKDFDIPIANLPERQDKPAICEECGYAYFIRRKERRKRTCAYGVSKEDCQHALRPVDRNNEKN